MRGSEARNAAAVDVDAAKATISVGLITEVVQGECDLLESLWRVGELAGAATGRRCCVSANTYDCDSQRAPERMKRMA